MKTPAALYDYRLPAEMIAQRPADPRDSSRLLAVNRSTGDLAHRHFSDIADYLREGDLLVVNDTRVFPARLFFTKDTGARVELLFVHPSDDDETAWVALARPGKRLKAGARLVLEKNPEIAVVVTGRDAEEGTFTVCFQKDSSPREIFERFGSIPLPPYIEKPLEDPERYQTVYSAAGAETSGVTHGYTGGSTAAPTAGLHFTPPLMERLRDAGCRFARVTLHIGYATFRPIRDEFVEDHPLHAEWYSVPAETAVEIARAKAAGRRVIAVGTTSVRTLESWAKTAPGGLPSTGASTTGASGWTRLYITEGFPFRATDALITNFHLPKSSLLVLTAAFCGRELLMRAYAEAIERGYRFYSLGDAMLIE